MKHSVREITKQEWKRIEDLFHDNKSMLEQYTGLLIWWNSKINLISRDVSRETVANHVKHSLMVSLFESFIESKEVLDTGAGGGLPGVPLSLCYSNKKFVINDIVAKKIFAVNDMINKLGLKEQASGLVSDIKDVEINPSTVIITKHAFKANDLFEYLKHKKWSKLIFLKGYQEALTEAERIREAVELKVIKLDPGFMSSVYDGKGVVELSRMNNE